MSKLKRFTSYKEVEVGQEVFMKWPKLALPETDADIPWRSATVVDVGDAHVVVELENGSRLTCENLKALCRVSEKQGGPSPTEAQ
jgi:hypothetical protein